MRPRCSIAMLLVFLQCCALVVGWFASRFCILHCDWLASLAKSAIDNGLWKTVKCWKMMQNVFSVLIVYQLMMRVYLSIHTKVRVYEDCVLNILLYGAESWATYWPQESKLSAFHTSCLQFILGRSWKYKITNEELFQITGSGPLSSRLKFIHLLALSSESVIFLMLRGVHSTLCWIYSLYFIYWQYGGRRYKLETYEGNHIDSMFIDKRHDGSDEGNILVS